MKLINYTNMTTFFLNNKTSKLSIERVSTKYLGITISQLSSQLCTNKLLCSTTSMISLKSMHARSIKAFLPLRFIQFYNIATMVRLILEQLCQCGLVSISMHTKKVNILTNYNMLPIRIIYYGQLASYSCGSQHVHDYDQL